MGLLALAVICPCLATGAEPGPEPELLLQELDSFPHARRIDRSEQAVVDYEVGLGAMQKRLGNWQFKDSERVDAERLRYTWQITDGFTSREVFDGLMEKVTRIAGGELLFNCQGRDCGNGAQWANGVFGQRILYGREAAQLYSVYRLSSEGVTYYLLTYAAARTSDRQYLHAELLTLAPAGTGSPTAPND